MSYSATAHVLLNTHQCIDCKKCMESCPKEVIGSVKFLFHKHVNIKQPDLCIGCMKCVRVCQQKAFIARNKPK